jgi:signal peptidase I
MEEKHRKPRSIALAIFVGTATFVYDVFKTVTTVLGVAFLIRFFLIQPFYVSGQSMEPTFENNQYIIVDQVSYRFHAPRRGDVVVFKYPKNVAFSFIKRIIGLPGDTVTIHNGEVTVTNSKNPDGLTLAEKYIASRTSGELTTTLEKDEYFVLGDNRPNSSDSRSWGILPKRLIIGKVWVVLYPFEAFKTIHTPAYSSK